MAVKEKPFRTLKRWQHPVESKKRRSVICGPRTENDRAAGQEQEACETAVIVKSSDGSP